MDKNFRQVTLQVKSSSQIIYVEAEEFSRFRFHRKRTACQNDDCVIPWTGGQLVKISEHDSGVEGVCQCNVIIKPSKSFFICRFSPKIFYDEPRIH